MKLNKLIFSALIATLLVPAANAALNYNSNDLVIAFSTGPVPSHTGNTYLVNFGNLSQFTSGIYSTGTNVVNSGSAANWLTDLSTAGISLSTATYSVQGIDPNGSGTDVYLTSSIQLPSGDGYNANSDIGTMLSQLGTASAVSVASNSFIQNTAAAGPTYGKYVFGSLSPTQAYENYGNIEASLSSPINFYIINDQSGPAQKLGSFSFNSSNGQLSFAAVPEPSTYALFGLSALALFVVARRRAQLAK